MNDYHTLWRGLRWVGSTSLLTAGYLAGLTVASSPASHTPAEGYIAVRPPASVASTACQAEQDAYTLAYEAYELAVNTLNDKYDDLYECQYGSAGEPDDPEPEPEHYVELAKLPSVLEVR